MKKILSLFLFLITIFSVVSLAGCGKNKTETQSAYLELGLGIYSDISNTSDATAQENGKGEHTEAVAVVLLDDNKKIVNCFLDTAENVVNYTSQGEFKVAESFTSKRQLGDSYNMKQASPIKLEWYQQADAFAKAVKGKTVDEVKALVADNGKPNRQVITAGCTINISDFVKAIEKAIENAEKIESKAVDSLSVKIETTKGECKNATENEDGFIELKSVVTATALSESKQVESKSEELSIKFTFDKEGKSTTK